MTSEEVSPVLKLLCIGPSGAGKSACQLRLVSSTRQYGTRIFQILANMVMSTVY